MKDYQVDASMGSHFFHNITSLNIGYLYVPHGSKKNFIDWQWLESLPASQEFKHFRHVRLEKPLTAIMAPRKKQSFLFLPE